MVDKPEFARPLSLAAKHLLEPTVLIEHPNLFQPIGVRCGVPDTAGIAHHQGAECEQTRVQTVRKTDHPGQLNSAIALGWLKRGDESISGGLRLKRCDSSHESDSGGTQNRRSNGGEKASSEDGAGPASHMAS